MGMSIEYIRLINCCTAMRVHKAKGSFNVMFQTGQEKKGVSLGRRLIVVGTLFG